MNLYLITQTENAGYDTYDSAVVAASTEAVARNTNPQGEWASRFSAWATSPDNVTVERIGVAKKPYSDGTIVLASFNAG